MTVTALFAVANTECQNDYAFVLKSCELMFPVRHQFRTKFARNREGLTLLDWTP